MNLLSALLLLASAAEQVPDGPRLIFVPSNAATTAVHIRFAIPDDAEEESVGRIYQSSQAMLLANGALPTTWRRDLFAGNAQAGSGTSAEDMRFLLTSSPAAFPALFTTFVGALFKPRLVEERFRRLEGHVPTQGSTTSTNGLLINAFAGRKPLRMPTKDRLLPFDAIAALVKRVVVPANATIVVSGHFDEQAIRAVLAKFTGGKPITNVHRRPTPSQQLLVGSDDLYVVIYGFEDQGLLLEAGLLILQEWLTSRLLEVLRAAGATYAVEVSLQRIEGLTCLMWVVPSRDNSKLDLLPYIDRILEDLMKKDDEQGFALARANVERRLQRYALSPADLVTRIDFGSINPDWLTPEFATLLGEVTLPSLQKAAPLRRDDRAVWRLVAGVLR